MQEKKLDMKKIGKLLLERRELSLILILILFIVVVAIVNPNFFQNSTQINTIVCDIAILVIVAIGQFYAILSGGIDLSVGSIIAFTGMACSMLNQYNPGLPMVFIVLAALGIGLGFGAINGALIAFGKIPPIITTLGTVNIYRGFTFVMSKNSWVTSHEMTDVYKSFCSREFIGIPHLIWISVFVVALFYVITKYTKIGRAMYAIGGNPVAARFVGVSEAKTRLVTFIFSGTLAGLAGLLWASRYSMAINDMAAGYEMNAVASCVLGGVNFAGGSGLIVGVLAGSIFFGFMSNALSAIYINAFWQLMVQGLVVLVSLAINNIVDNRKAQKLLEQRRTIK